MPDDPRYPPPRFAVPIIHADCYKQRGPDGVIHVRYTVNDLDVPEEIFAAAVAELGSVWPRPPSASRPEPTHTLPYVHRFARMVPRSAHEWAATFGPPEEE